MSRPRRPLPRPSTPARVLEVDERLLDVERKSPGHWLVPGTDPTTIGMLNGWSHASFPYDEVSYRRGYVARTIQFKGHAVPGSSGTVAFVIEELEGVVLPDRDVSFVNDILVGVDSFSIARFFIDHTSGEVTITYPAT